MNKDDVSFKRFQNWIARTRSIEKVCYVVIDVHAELTTVQIQTLIISHAIFLRHVKHICVQTILSSRDSDGYVLPQATGDEDTDIGTVQCAGQADHGNAINEDNSMEIDAVSNDATHNNASVNVTSKINSLLKEEEKQLPQWTVGKYRANFKPYITSTGYPICILTYCYNRVSIF